MVGKATLRYVRISPRKVRRVIDLIRGKDCVQALAQLDHLNKRAAFHVQKVLRSALQNVQTRSGYGPEQLFVSKVVADKGPHMKRFRARAMGRAAAILKRMSHVSVELDLRPGAEVTQEKPSGRLATIGKRFKRKVSGKTAKAAGKEKQSAQEAT